MPALSHARFAVLGLLAAAAAVAYVGRNGMTVAEKEVRADLKLTEDEMGFLLGPAFFLPYALLSVPTAWVAQRYGPRAAMPLFMVVSAVGVAAFGLAGGFTVLVLARVVAGAGQAGLFPGCTQAIGRWHPTTERALATGVLGASMSVGGAIAASLTGQLLGPVGWRNLSYWYAVPGLLWAAACWAWFRNDPPGQVTVTKAAARVGWELWTALAQSRALWLICGQQFCRAAGYIFFTSWFATYLRETRGVTLEVAGHLNTMPLLGTIAGMLVGGTVSDWVYRRTGSLTHARKTVTLGTLAVCTGFMFTAFFVTNVYGAVALIAVGAFFAGAAGPLAYAVTIDLGGRHVPLVFATMNMAGNLGAAALPQVAPVFRRFVDSQPVLMELCGGNSWNAVLLLFASMYVTAAACWVFLDLSKEVAGDAR